jgi:HEXXH motif-containing protein
MSDLPAGLLCLPGPKDSAVRRLQNKVRLIALRAFLTTSAEGISSRAGRSFHLLQAVVGAMARDNKRLVLDAIGTPDVLNPLLVLAAGMRPVEEILRQVVPALMAVLARNARSVPEAVLWEAPVDLIPCVQGGWRLMLNPPGRALLLDPSGLTVELHDGARLQLPEDADLDHASMSLDRPFLPLGQASQGIWMSVHDANPLSMEEAHPEKSGNQVALGEYSAKDWAARLEEALELIATALPLWSEETPWSLSRIVPVGFEPEMHLSASYREAPEVIYMTLHPDPLTMAEAIIHETQHSKCNLLSWLDPMLHNAYSTWTESPVRPDLRPVMGVLLAVHAFVPVAAFHQRLAQLDHPLSRTHQFEVRREQVLAGNEGGLKIVRSRGEPTPTGGRLIAALEELHGHLLDDGAVKGLSPDVLPPG